ncbi:MAG: SDR family NAD(P)-dependent oxidoreductase [Hyphomicrobiales bacterium]|nr:MAG: SDR family NAD(P)-dependent oxidoreductase [Hyphomicrobiales bacterium]
MSGFEGKTVIVTGAARGIGRRIAERTAAEGAHVVVADILSDEAAVVAETILSNGGQASHCHLDITDPASASRLADEVLASHGRIDALVNNAGLDAPHGQAWEIDEAHWRHVIEVDLNGAWWCSRAVIPAMMGRRAGRIIFISSLASRIGAPSLSPAYATAKAGLIGLTVSLSSQLEPHGILVNAITPGPTGDTGRPYSDEGRDAYLAAHPLGFGGAQPIAEGVLHLLGKGGEWMSGSILNISGGHFRGI